MWELLCEKRNSLHFCCWRWKCMDFGFASPTKLTMSIQVDLGADFHSMKLKMAQLESITVNDKRKWKKVVGWQQNRSVRKWNTDKTLKYETFENSYIFTAILQHSISYELYERFDWISICEYWKRLFGDFPHNNSNATVANTLTSYWS